MATITWTPDELDRIAAADELDIAARRADGTLRKAVPIWVVRVDDALYVRSWRGLDGSWFRTAHATREGHISAGGVEHDVALLDAADHVSAAVDAAYRDKYRRYPSYVPPMISAQAQATTLQLQPQVREG
jgi:hypothetical protein